MKLLQILDVMVVYLIFLLAIAYKLPGIISVIALIVGMMMNGLIEDEEVVPRSIGRGGEPKKEEVIAEDSRSILKRGIDGEKLGYS